MVRIERWTMPFQFKCIGTLRYVLRFSCAVTRTDRLNWSLWLVVRGQLPKNNPIFKILLDFKNFEDKLFQAILSYFGFFLPTPPQKKLISVQIWFDTNSILFHLSQLFVS